MGAWISASPCQEAAECCRHHQSQEDLESPPFWGQGAMTHPASRTSDDTAVTMIAEKESIASVPNFGSSTVNQASVSRIACLLTDDFERERPTPGARTSNCSTSRTCNGPAVHDPISSKTSFNRPPEDAIHPGPTELATSERSAWWDS
jgi:hypothetical protein